MKTKEEKLFDLDMILEKFKNLELYKNEISKDINKEYEDWQYDLDRTKIVDLINELEQIFIFSESKLYTLQDLIDCCGEVSCEDGTLVGKTPAELYKWIENKKK